ncbi:MAG: HEAT repeat domain-containing protein [Bryobacterales bacterium]|nr:HEAT repeat domain-containing protein [Bryobacterales bacterium]
MDIDLNMLSEMGAWEWPEGSAAAIKKVLRDQEATVEDRALAAQLGGEIVVMDDEMAGLLVALAESAEAPVEVRERAAIALGPVLELCDVDGFDDPYAEPSITEPVFAHIKETLRAIHSESTAPKSVRRRALEAAVRAEGDWHGKAIADAYASNDPEWKLTAVFCMQHVNGFEKQILESLESENPELRFEAVRAAGGRGVKAAWPQVLAILAAEGEGDKDLLLAAIDAAGSICPEEETDILLELLDSEDEEIADAARDALDSVELGGDDEDLEDEDFEEDDEDDEPGNGDGKERR